MDIRRFARFHANEKFLHERVPEELGLHYAIGYPGREPRTARGVRKSPIHDRLAERGAQFGTRMGWERAAWFADKDDPVPAPLRFGRPAWFDAEARESRAARSRVALFDQSSFTKLLVDGADAETVLQRLCANDVAVAPGRIVYTGMLNENGGYESDLTVFRISADRFLLVTGTAQAVRDLHWISGNIVSADRVSVVDLTGSLAVFGVMGPKTRALLQTLTSRDLGNDVFPLFTSREIPLGSATVRAARLSYVGEVGWELYVPMDMAPGLYDALTSAGSVSGLCNAGTHALNSLRIEKGYRAWGHELTPDDTPLEAGLAFATKLKTDVPFLGREALLRQQKAGLQRRLIHFRLDDPDVFIIGDEPILYRDDIAGQTTSAAFGHSIGSCVGMAYVNLEGRGVNDMIAGGGFELELATERHPISVSLSPFFDPSGKRMRAGS